MGQLYATPSESTAFDRVPDYYPPGAVRHGGFRDRLEGQEALQGYLQASLGGLSNIERTAHRCVAEDEIVVDDVDMAMKHSGGLFAVPAPGNPFEITTAALFRLADGRITDE